MAKTSRIVSSLVRGCNGGIRNTAVPVSTVAIEETFSMSGNILKDKRSRLKLETLDAQTCIDYWCKADYHEQENKLENFENLCNNTNTTNIKGSMTRPPSPDEDK